MQEFQIEIKEELARVETIQAETLGEAIDKAMELYYDQKIILDAEDGRLDRVLSTPDFEEVPGPHPDIARIFRNRNRSFHE